MKYIYTPIAFISILSYKPTSPTSAVLYLGFILLCLIPYVVARALWCGYNKKNCDNPLQLKLDQKLGPDSYAIFSILVFGDIP